MVQDSLLLHNALTAPQKRQNKAGGSRASGQNKPKHGTHRFGVADNTPTLHGSQKHPCSAAQHIRLHPGCNSAEMLYLLQPALLGGQESNPKCLPVALRARIRDEHLSHHISDLKWPHILGFFPFLPPLQMVSLTWSSPKRQEKQEGALTQGRCKVRAKNLWSTRQAILYSKHSLVKDIVACRETVSGWLNVELFGTNSIKPGMPFAFKYAVFSKLAFFVEAHWLRPGVHQGGFRGEMLGTVVTSSQGKVVTHRLTRLTWRQIFQHSLLQQTSEGLWLCSSMKCSLNTWCQNLKNCSKAYFGSSERSKAEGKPGFNCLDFPCLSPDYHTCPRCQAVRQGILKGFSLYFHL